LKTLHITNCWHSSSGGIATFYKALFDAAERARHLIRLVVPGESTSIEHVGEFGRIYRIEAPRAPLNPQYRLVLPHRYLFPRTALQRIINDERPDLIEISDKYAVHYLGGLLRTSRLPGVRIRPAIVGMSHERMDENMAAYVSTSLAARRFCRWYMKWIYFPMFDHHITVSEHTAEELILASRGHKVSRGIWISPMGVDADRFTPARKSAAVRQRLREVTRADYNSTILFYAGRLAPEKNLPLLIATMVRLDPSLYRLALAGDGILVDDLKCQCAAAGLANVSFLGHVGDRELLADYYANADIFVHPNPREPYGIAPLEAMASGIPLVAPDTGGVTAYANETNAWLAESNPVAFAGRIESVRADATLRIARIAAARATAEERRWPAVASKYLRLYRELNAIVLGDAPGDRATGTVAARTWSTPGDFFGREYLGS
jgi:alpha-1,6-mannosyltransferase